MILSLQSTCTPTRSVLDLLSWLVIPGRMSPPYAKWLTEPSAWEGFINVRAHHQHQGEESLPGSVYGAAGGRPRNPSPADLSLGREWGREGGEPNRV